MICCPAQRVLRVLLAGLAIGLNWLAVELTPGFAQTAVAPSSNEKPSDSGKPTVAPGLKTTTEDVVQLIGPNGQPIFIPRGNTWAAFQKFMKSQQVDEGPTAPPFSISGVSFEGIAEANEDIVTLDATLTVSINRDGVDVLVPLRLNEATLLKKIVHVGPNDAEFDEFDRDAGYRCWLRGKGQHELKMNIAVPIRKQGTTRRVILRLPETPGSSIKLVVPIPKVAAKGIERAVVLTKSLENGRTEIQAFGPPGNLLDLSWQPVSDVSESRPELQSRTVIMAELKAETLALEVTQVIAALQGSFQKIVVRLPPEFEFLEVFGHEVKESSVAAGSPPRVVVTLTAPTSGPVELKWLLSAKIAANAKQLPTIEGFEIEDSRQQKGHVAITAWEGVNLRDRKDESRFIEQDNLTALRDVPGIHAPSSTSGNTTVYRIQKQPFRLILDVQKIEPYFSAEQNHLVRLSAGRADLESSLLVRVFRGSLLDLTLPWPGYKAEGWESIANDTPEVVEQVAVEETPGGPQLRVRLVDRKTRSDHEFEIRLATRRAIPTDGSEFDLSLPFVAASGQKASKIIVAPSTNLDVEWIPKNETLSRPTTPDEKILDVLESTRNVTAWRWETGSPTFAAKTKVQQQSIRTESTTSLTFETQKAVATQSIGYEVEFEPLTQVRLMVPRVISDRVRFHLRDSAGQSKPLPPPVFTALEIDQARQCRISLDPPQVGKFDVLAEFDIERPNVSSDETSQLNIPVLQSSDAEFTATRAKWKTGEKLVASLDDSSWKPELGSDNTSLWKAAGAKSAIALKIGSTADSALQDFTVHRALIRTVVSEGRRHSQALFELDRDVTEMSLTLPQGISPQQFQAWWNGTSISVNQSATANEREIEVRLRRPDVPKKTEKSAAIDPKSVGILWLDYYSEEPTHFTWSNQHRLVAPKFASTVWVAQTIWEVILPPDQHLLTTPRDYATQFHWQRSLLLWNRHPNFGYDRIERVLNDAAPNKNDAALWEAISASDASANVYPLSCFGPPQPLVFWSMSRSAVVGCGAGLALVLGFLLIRIPATRHVLTFLAVGFGMALAALWFSEPVKVLLQPAILGAAMAVVAAIIDRVGKREPAAPIVTLSSPSDFFSGSGSGMRVGGVPVLADAASSGPPQPNLPTQPVSGSGSGVRP